MPVYLRVKYIIAKTESPITEFKNSILSVFLVRVAKMKIVSVQIIISPKQQSLL